MNRIKQSPAGGYGTSTPKLAGNHCQCAACGEYFSSVWAFDRHRAGKYGVDRHCIPTAELLAKGWTRNVRGFIRTPATAGFSDRLTPKGKAGVLPRVAPPELPPAQAPETLGGNLTDTPNSDDLGRNIPRAGVGMPLPQARVPQGLEGAPQ